MFVGSVWTVSHDTYLEVMCPPAQPPTHQPLPTHPPPSLNLTPPHSFGRFKSKDYQNIYFISFSTFQENKLYHFFFCVMMVKAILMKWPPPGTEIMRMQARIQVKAEPSCNSRTPDTWTRGGGAAACSLLTSASHNLSWTLPWWYSQWRSFSSCFCVNSDCNELHH